MRQELEVLVHDLQRDVERNEEVSLRQKRRIEKMKKQMDEENQELRRKAALGWMLGSLSGTTSYHAYQQNLGRRCMITPYPQKKMQLGIALDFGSCLQCMEHERSVS
jgi:hypothetical protein